MHCTNKFSQYLKILSGCLFLTLMFFLCGCGKTDRKQIESASDLNGETIAILEGSPYETDIEELFPDSDIVPYLSYADCIKAVESQRAAAYVAEEPLAISQAEDAGDLTCLSEDLVMQEYAFMLNRENTQLKEEINQTMAQLEADGVIAELKTKWVEAEDSPTIERDPEADTSKGTLKVITSSDAKPLSYISNGEVVGYEAELISRIAEKLGYDVEISTAEFSALIPAITEGKMDVAFGCISVTAEREEMVGFSNAGYESSIVAVIPKDTQNAESIIENLKNSCYRTFIKEERWKLLWDGMLVTLKISIFSIILGSLLGFAVSFPLRGRNRPVKLILRTISRILDGLPMVVILMVLYYVVFSKSSISAEAVAVIGFTIDFANTVAGLLNAGVETVGKGQIEAAASMGYNKMQIYKKIVFPQAATNMFPQYQGAVVGLVKGTAVVGYITVDDLTKAGDAIRSLTYEAFFPLLVTAAAYFVLSCIFVICLRHIGARFSLKNRPRKVYGVETNDND